MDAHDAPLPAPDKQARRAIVAHAAVERDGPLPARIGDEITRILGVVLRRISTEVEQLSYRQWQFRMPGKNRHARLQVAAGWLRIGLSMSRLPASIDSKSIANLLTGNARIKGGPRIIICPVRHERRLVIDLPLEILPWDDEAELESLLATAITSLGNALNKKPADAVRPTHRPLFCERLDAILEDDGWSVYRGEDDGLEVPLEVPGRHFTAAINLDDHGIHLRVPLFTEEFASASYPCRSATTLMLCLATSHLRMVKATGSRRRLGLEVSLPLAAVTAALLLHGCAALSVALQQLAAEAELLIADRRLAKLYLSNPGFPKATLAVSHSRR